MKVMYTRLIKEGKFPKLAIADVVELDKKNYLITRLNVPEAHRGKGIGTEILKEITNDADSECSVLLIEPSPYGEKTKTKIKRLIKFYEKFDFKFKSKNEYMRRDPMCKRQ